jgi:hypothetical protein
MALGQTSTRYVRFEVLTAVTMEIALFWDVTPCGSCMNRCFGGTYCLHHLHSISSRRARFLVTANVVSNSSILVALMMEMS